MQNNHTHPLILSNIIPIMQNNIPKSKKKSIKIIKKYYLYTKKLFKTSLKIN